MTDQRKDLPCMTLACSDSLDVLEVDHLGLAFGRVRLRIVPAGPDGAAEGLDTSVHLDERKARELFIWLAKWLHA